MAVILDLSFCGGMKVRKYGRKRLIGLFNQRVKRKSSPAIEVVLSRTTSRDG